MKLQFLALRGAGSKLPRWTWWALGGVTLLLLTRKEDAMPDRPPSTGSTQAKRLAQLHPELAKRWKLAAAEYKLRYPGKPQPHLATTFRSRAEQAEAYATGRRGIPGEKRITNAKPGESLHNYLPALAFDVFFPTPIDQVGYGDDGLFILFAQIAKGYGLAWGGDWPGFKDRPHFEPPNYSWRDAAAGRTPRFPPLRQT